MRERYLSAAVTLLLIALAGLALLVIGCSDDDPNPVVPVQADINVYLNSLPTWEQFSPPLPEEDTAVEPTEMDFDGTYFCRTTPCSITKTPEQIVTFGQVPNILYLGSLIQGDSYLGGLGSMEELPIRQRAPLTIGLDLLTGGDVTNTVEDPTAATVQSALSTMIEEAASSGVQSGSSIYYNKKEMCSLNQATLGLGLSFKYLGASAKTELSVSTTVEKHTIVAYFKQTMFEAYVVQPQTPREFFSADFTQALLDEQKSMDRIGPDNLPVYVSRMMYGRLMMFTMTSTRSVDSMRFALEASYSSIGAGGSATIDASLLDILDESEYTVVTIGGAASTALSMLKTGELADYFAADDPITTAKPIAYVLCNLADNSAAKVSETTTYDLKECVQSSIGFFWDWEEWKTAFDVVMFPTDTVFFPTDSPHVVLATEVNSVNQDPGTIMPQQITFEAANTGLDFTFYLKGLQSGCAKPLTYNDQEFDQANSGFISIGDKNDCSDDDFEIVVTETFNGSHIFAMGFYLGDNGLETTEELQVWNGDDMVASYKESDDALPPMTNNTAEWFLGVVSTTPITKLVFLENVGSDDVLMRNFYFGVAHPTR